MNFFKRIVDILQKPFPEDERRDYYRNTIVLSVFVTFFLFVFEPFGIDTLKENQFLICLGFGLMTLLACAVYELLVYQLLNLKGQGERWTFGKWIFHNLMIVLVISMANFLFARLLLFGFIDWNLFPTMIYSTFMIGIIPVTVLGAYTLFKNERKFQEIAREINPTDHNLNNTQEDAHLSILDIPVHRIRYVEALQNYAKIGYLNEEGQTKVQTERITLKEILTKTKGSPIIKCHRSFLVNKDAIISISGNAQGLLLSLSECDKVIPVSRTLVPIFRQL